MMWDKEEFEAVFYADLINVINRFPRKDKVMVLGDFNTRVSSDFQMWPDILGHHCIRKANSNGHLLFLSVWNWNCQSPAHYFSYPIS